MEKIDTKFNLRGKDQETITVTVNGNSGVAGVKCVLDAKPIQDTFTLDKASKVVFLSVHLDFNQCPPGDPITIQVKGDQGPFISETKVPRVGADRLVQYRFETV